MRTTTPGWLVFGIVGAAIAVLYLGIALADEVGPGKAILAAVTLWVIVAYAVVVITARRGRGRYFQGPATVPAEGLAMIRDSGPVTTGGSPYLSPFGLVIELEGVAMGERRRTYRIRHLPSAEQALVRPGAKVPVLFTPGDPAVLRFPVRRRTGIEIVEARVTSIPFASAA